MNDRDRLKKVFFEAKEMIESETFLQLYRADSASIRRVFELLHETETVINEICDELWLNDLAAQIAPVLRED